MRSLLCALLLVPAVFARAQVASPAAADALYDYRADPPKDDERDDLLFKGYRFEPATGHVLSPKTHKPLTVAQFQGLFQAIAAEMRHSGLERLAALVDAADPAQPLDALTRAQAQTIAEKTKQSDALRTDLTSLSALAGSLSTEIGRAYLDSTRVFDGKLTARELQERAQPLTKPKPDLSSAGYFDKDERRLGQVLQRVAVAALSRNPVGAKLLSNFQDQHGAYKLPSMLILDIDSHAAAVYSNGAMAFSLANVVDSIVETAPESQQAVLKARLSDSRALARYLRQEPAALDAFFRDNDDVIAHELTHAWQHRREPFWSEIDRDNFPDADYVELEHEAYLTQMRFTHEKFKADPEAFAEDDSQLDMYRQFAADLDGWRDQITQEYLQTWPHSAATLPTGEAMERERFKAAQSLSTLSAWWKKIEGLKILGLKQGEVQEKGYQAGGSRAVEKFRGNGYAQLQRESLPLLARVFLAKAGREDAGFQRDVDLKVAAAYAAAAGDAKLSAKIAAERGDKR